jgi:trypsin
MKYKFKWLLLFVLSFLLVACPGKAPVPSIEGLVYEDLNANGKPDSGEKGLGGIKVFLDTDNDGEGDAAEVFQITDSQGKYRFEELKPGIYNLRQELPFGYRNVTGGVAPSTLASANITIKAHRTLDRKGSKIVGGVDADHANFPFIVALGQKDGVGFFQFCGASLISDRWVLTAAHCSVDEEGNALDPVALGLQALVGTDDLTAGGQRIDISEVIVHPSYVSVEKGFDVALWKLAEPVSLTTTLRTIDMLDAATTNLAADDVLATAMGWGALASGASGPAKLQVVHVPITNAQQCLEANQNVFEIDNFDTQICAGVLEGGIDTCQGDSGGPLVVRNSANDRWFQAGITSYGFECAAPGFAGIYARVSALSDWVKTTTRELSNRQTITVAQDPVTEVNFGNQVGLRPFIGTIEPRWQATNLTPDPAEPVAGDNVMFSWRILDEGTSTFSCQLDFDGAEAGVPVNVPCAEGETSVSSPAGYAEGVYLPTLLVSKAAITQTREIPLVAGNPLSDTKTGALTATDAIDVDYEELYYIDYYQLDLTAIPAGRAILIKLDATGFESYLGLYDGDLRDPLGGGGLLASGLDSLLFKADGSTNYVMGISSFEPEATGSYSLSISSGSLDP